MNKLIKPRLSAVTCASSGRVHRGMPLTAGSNSRLPPHPALSLQWHKRSKGAAKVSSGARLHDGAWASRPMPHSFWSMAPKAPLESAPHTEIYHGKQYSGGGCPVLECGDNSPLAQPRSAAKLGGVPPFPRGPQRSEPWFHPGAGIPGGKPPAVAAFGRKSGDQSPHSRTGQPFTKCRLLRCKVRREQAGAPYSNPIRSIFRGHPYLHSERAACRTRAL